MQARRTHVHGPDGGWSSIALHLQPAEAPHEGFYLTMFSEARPAPTQVFLRPTQLAQLLDLAAEQAATDHQLWEVVSKIPLEPLLPSRTLAARLRWLLVDCAAALREQIRAQEDRRPPPPEPPPGGFPPEPEGTDGEPAADEPPKPSWS